MAGRKNFVAGEILTAADVNSFLMDQSVMVFDDSAARGSAIPTPSEGMVTYRKDDNAVEVFDGSSFGPIGGILQVVSTTKTNTFSATGSSFVDVTGMSASITPSSTSSKVLVLVNMMTSASGTSADFARLVRNGTAISVGSSGDGYWVSNTFSASEGLGLDMPVTFLDSPGSTSSLTYKIQIGGTVATSTRFVNRRGISATPVAVSSITLMEVAV